jgi:hypothetical protein
MRRPRFRLRSLLIAVAIMAALLGWLARPYPFSVRVGGGPSRIAWSNGSETQVGPAGPLPRRWRHRGPLIGRRLDRWDCDLASPGALQGPMGMVVAFHRKRLLIALR